MRDTVSPADLQMPDRCIRILRGDHHHHADTAVEGAEHFLRFDIAAFAQPVEQFGHLPGLAVDVGDHVGGQHARHVLGDAAAGDVRHAFHGELLHQRQQRFYVQTSRRHDAVGQCALAVEFGIQVGLAALDDLAHQRIAVGVRAVGGQPQHHVARD